MSHTTSNPSTIWRGLNPWSMVVHLARYGDLLRQFTVRELQGRYRGSSLGFLWSFVTPLLMLSVYTFVFGHLLGVGAKFGGAAASAGAAPLRTGEFAMVLFCGLIVFNLLAETLLRAPTLVVGNPNYVKKVVFPLEILPLAVLLANLAQALISTLVLLIGVAAFLHHVPVQALYYPLVLVPLVMLCGGLAWLAAALGVFFRDIIQVLTVAIQLLMFLTPIFYSPAMIPERFRWILQINPLALIINDARGAMIWGQAPDWPAWGMVTAFSFVVMMIGYAWFMKTKPWFADAI